jgi:hypothetical protein
MIVLRPLLVRAHMAAMRDRYGAVSLPARAAV